MVKPGELFAEFFEMDSAAMETLGRFFKWLQTPPGGGRETKVASALSHDADRYAREFLIEVAETPLGGTGAGFVASYLGNWWIINTLTPTIEEQARITTALAAFHRFLAAEGLTTQATLREVEKTLGDSERFKKRLENFWELTPDGIDLWRGVDDYRRTAKIH